MSAEPTSHRETSEPKHKNESQSSRSIWQATGQGPKTPQLERNVNTGVCVVGAGIAGLTVAYLLAKEGRSVTVVDKKSVGAGETLNTSAHLSSEIDATYKEIARLHGEEGARLAAESHTAAIAKIEEIVNSENIDCDFRRVDGFLFLGLGDKPAVLDEEMRAARQAGIEVEKLARGPLERFSGPCLRFSAQAQFHPSKYVRDLAQAFQRLGGTIFGETEITAFNKKNEESLEVTTSSGHIIAAASIVVATDTPVNDLITMHTKQAAYRTYVIGAEVPLNSVPAALYWDTEDPFHYVRLQRIREGTRERDILLIGGQDHKTGQAEETEDHFARLLSWGNSHFSGLGEPEFRWSGQIMDSADGLAFIGRNPGDKNIYIVTGDSGVGLTHATIAGMLICDSIVGRENPWATLYDPSRKALRAMLTLAEENINVAVQYSSWVSPGGVANSLDVAPGTGAVIRKGLSKIAVYRDDTGKLHERSAVCPHLGCIVDWNAVERSWDCPCHGSRFSPEGLVLNGPAIRPLSPVEL